MTRVLLATTPMTPHVRPTAPLARELAAAGHEVLWYTGSAFEELVTSTGAAFAATGVTVTRPAAGGRGLAGLTDLVLQLFLRPIPEFVADLEPVLDRFAPDVVVADVTFRAGLFLAERRGLPRVALSVGPLNLSSADTAPFGTGLPPPATPAARLANRWRYWKLYHLTSRRLQHEARQIRAALGLPPLPGYFIDWVARIADRYLLASIPEFEYPRSDLPASVRYVGLMREAGIDDWAPPPWWPDIEAARASSRPVIFLTQGTVTNDPASLLLPAATALAATGPAAGALLIASTSGRDPDTVLPPAQRPPNLRLADFIPYHAILPAATLMITNGGYGGVQLALSHGVPIIAAGSSEDKHETNQRMVRTGAGLSLGTDDPGPDQIAAAVRRVLGDPAYQASAARLQEAYARYPGAPLAAAIIAEAAGVAAA